MIHEGGTAEGGAEGTRLYFENRQHGRRIVTCLCMGNPFGNARKELFSIPHFGDVSTIRKALAFIGVSVQNKLSLGKSRLISF